MSFKPIFKHPRLCFSFLKAISTSERVFKSVTIQIPSLPLYLKPQEHALEERTPPCTIWELSGNHEQPPLSISVMAKTRGEPHAPWDHTHQASHSIFKPPKTIIAHSSSWELQLRRLCHPRRLLEQRSMSWPNPLRRPPQSHYLHRTLPLLAHLYNFCIYLLY